MANNWDALAAHWEDDEVNIEFVESAYKQLEKCIDISGKHILDFGCGSGLLTEFLSPVAKSVVALDASEAMIEELDKKNLKNVEPIVDRLTRGLVAQHPAFRKQFDVVVASAVCGYLDNNLSECLTIISSLLNKGGVFIHWDWIHDEEDRTSGVSMIEMQDELIQAGFHDVRISQVFRIRNHGGDGAVMMGVAVR